MSIFGNFWKPAGRTGAGGQHRPTLEHLREEISTRNPAVAFLQGYAGIPVLIAEQLEAALSDGTIGPAASVTYDAQSRSIGISLDGPQDVTVIAWWGTSFVHPEPKSTSRVILDEELPPAHTPSRSRMRSPPRRHSPPCPSARPSITRSSSDPCRARRPWRASPTPQAHRKRPADQRDLAAGTLPVAHWDSKADLEAAQGSSTFQDRLRAARETPWSNHFEGVLMSASKRLMHARPRSGLTRMRTTLLACLAALFSVAAGVPYGITEASAAPVPSMQTYLGYWNYDQPNPATLNNVLVLACPDGGGQCDPQLPLPLKVPQVGWVLFSPGPNGTVNGRTDQGCSWNFKVTPTDLELSSTTQQCFNHDIGSSGNITKWSVTVTGNHEHEEIVSVSHQPNGVDLIGTIKSGSRTRVDGSGGAKSSSRFLGGYTYNPADFSTLTNVVVTDKGTAYPEQGTVQFTRKNRSTILAHTPNGCSWTLAVRGNTAELDPATQTCHLADSETSLRYWAIVTDDGVHMTAFRAGSTTLNGQQPANNYLFIGALTRSAPAAAG